MFDILFFGALGGIAYFSPDFSKQFIFQENHIETTLGINIFGAYWLTISVCSAIGLTSTLVFLPINLLKTIMMFLIIIINIYYNCLNGVFFEGLCYISIFYFITLCILTPWNALRKNDIEQILIERLKDLEDRQGLWWNL